MSQGKVENRAELLMGQNSVVAQQWNGYKKVFNRIFFMLNHFAQNRCAYCIRSKTKTIMHKSGFGNKDCCVE